MLGIKTKIIQTEKLKTYLLKENILNKNLKLIKEKDSIIIPVKRLTEKNKNNLLKKFKEIKFTDKKFEKIIQKQNYKDLLKNKLPERIIGQLPSSFDIIGDILIIEIKENIKKYEKQIADALIKTNKNIKTILKKSGIHEGEFRLQKLKYLAGIKTKETIYKENNVKLKLNVEKVYFSPRLSTERKRIYKLINPGEEILVMFSGAAPYPIVISKNTKAKSISAIEKNPIAHKYALENLKLNKINNIELYCEDVKNIIPLLNKKFDRILMPLPKGAEDFLDLALSVSKKGTIIHFYDFEHEYELRKGDVKVKSSCIKANRKFKILKTVKCGQYSPGKFRLCIDFKLV
ncbi:class I SAM-dependent methyltransferase family protein [Candidatus Woesearchaeota archaeon]|nr:class I SAM-dependent methyltransferase family protein [Candidatus Woesearchaeota archaeon]